MSFAWGPIQMLIACRKNGRPANVGSPPWNAIVHDRVASDKTFSSTEWSVSKDIRP